MLNYPDAMESMLYAEKISTDTGNDSIATLSLRAMMDLSDSICDNDKKAQYAIKACDIYKNNSDYDNMYDILSNFYLFDESAHRHADTIKYYASYLLENDTAHNNYNSQRNQQLLSAINGYGSYNYYEWLFNVELKAFAPGQFIQQIKSNKGWQEEITNDSANISAKNAHLITVRLWEEGLDDIALTFINFYRKSYPEKFIRTYFDPTSGQIKSEVSFKLLDPRKEEFRATFQHDVQSVVTRFHYEEGVIKEQTIRHQRIVIIMASVIIAIIIIAIIMYLRLARMRRQRREDNNMRVAAELRTALHSLEELHLTTLSRLCETYYESTSKDSVKSRVARDTLKAIEEIAASPEFYSMLESRLNTEDGNAVTLLRAEIPGIKEQDVRLYLCNASGFSIPTMCMILNERREVIYNRRLRLRTRIQESDAEHRDMFLNHLR